MILSNLKNSEVYEGLHPLFKKAFDYLKSQDFTTIPAGKIVLDGEKLYVSVSELNGKKTQEARIETHNKYIDIQYLIQGKECMGWRTTDQCNQVTVPYNPEKDITFFGDQPTAYVQMTPGDFVIFFPEDGHAPCIGDGFIKKVIVKVLL